MTMSEHRLPEPDRPWVMRTYAGHSDARRSNDLYRRNLEKGQTGLSVAFDLPTQTGYDPDHVLARGEVGKVGVSIANKGDMHQLLDQIPIRPASRSPSTCRRRRAMTPTTSSPAVRSARSVSRSPTKATCTSCSTRSRSDRPLGRLRPADADGL